MYFPAFSFESKRLFKKAMLNDIQTKQAEAFLPVFELFGGLK